MWLPVVFDSTSWSWARSCPITFQVELDIHLDLYHFFYSDSPPLSPAALYCVHICCLSLSVEYYVLSESVERSNHVLYISLKTICFNYPETLNLPPLR